MLQQQEELLTFRTMHVGLQQRSELGCELVADVAGRFGEVRLRVTGASMMPAIWPGDVITVRDIAALQLGQIVLYRREGKLVAHRIIRRHNGFLTTRGDALPQDDPPVLESDIVGQLVGIARNSRSINLKQSFVQRVGSFTVRHSDFCLRMALHWHNRMRRRASGEIAWTG